MQQGLTLAAAISATIEWLAGDECHALDGAALAAELGRRLRSAGLPLDHLGLYLRTLHPEILGHTIGWAPDEPVQVYRRPHDYRSLGWLPQQSHRPGSGDADACRPARRPAA